MSGKTFDILVLNGRPAAGKSEIIDHLRKTPLKERIERFHIGDFEEFDDFPILWDAFESDDIFEKVGMPRLISNPTFTYKGETLKGYHFKEKSYWNFLITKLCYNYSKKIKSEKDYHERKTAIFEFARGSEHGGWKTAYSYLSEEVIKKACTVYINVSWEESLRKNLRRHRPGKEDSILHHSLESKKMELIYKESDWEDFSAADKNYLLVEGFKIPYAIFENEPEKTDKPDALDAHLEEILTKLWKIKNQ